VPARPTEFSILEFALMEFEFGVVILNFQACMPPVYPVRSSCVAFDQRAKFIIESPRYTIPFA